MRGNWLFLFVAALLVGAITLFLASGGAELAGMADQDFARLVYLGAIVAALSTGVLFVGRAQLGPAVRNAAIWGVILLILVAGYASRAELEGIWRRTQSALLPGTPVPAGIGQAIATRGNGRGFEIDARVNGVPVRMLVDTGATIVAIDRPTAEAAGIDLSDLRYVAEIRTANGVASAAPVRLDEIEVGEIVRRNVQAVVTDGEGIGVDLLGMSFLDTLSSVDFRGDRLVLTD